MQTTDFLMMIRRITKLHESMLKEVCEHYHLTLIEAHIISFLYNNPGKDTAGDIVELRMLAKGNVSQGVESLIRKGLLERRTDTKDRRKIHLSLLPAAKPITLEMETLWENFHREIFFGLSRQEQTLFDRISEQMMSNAEEAIKRRDAI